MKALQYIVLFLIVVGCSQVHAQTRVPESIVMFVGDTRVIEADTTRVAIGNGSIVSVSSPAPGQLLFLGATPGVTTVNIWTQSGEQYRIAVNVTESDINAALETVHKLLEGTENIRARIAGNRIVLEGDRVRDADQKRADSITESFGGLVMNFIGKLGFEEMIHFNVKIIEVRRTAVRQLGIRWDTTAAGPTVGIASSIDVRLNTVLNSQIELLEQKGQAYVIAEPTLSCRSGGTAHFVSGGELPIPITDGLGQTTVEFKEFGVILDVKPVSDRSGTIYAQIDTEVSQVDDSVRVLGVPGFTKRKSVTEVNMREGETIAIAGLVDRSRTKDRTQVPGLGNLPVVGAAFRTTQTRNTETELLVLISPRIVTAQVRPGMLAADPNGDALRRADQILSSREAPPRNLAPIAPPADQPPAPLPPPAPVPQSAPAPASPRSQPVYAPAPATPRSQPVSAPVPAATQPQPGHAPAPATVPAPRTQTASASARAPQLQPVALRTQTQPVPVAAPAPRPQPAAVSEPAPQAQRQVASVPAPAPQPAAVPVYEAQYYDPRRPAPSAAAASGSAESEAQKPKRRSLLSVLNSREELTPEEEQARQERLAKRAAADQRDLERRIRLLGPTARVYLPNERR
jgi:pilus assembly protein CpaC